MQLALDYKEPFLHSASSSFVTERRSEEFSMATSCGSFAKTQHIKDRLVSGGSAGKPLLGRGGGGGEDRSFYKQCTCSSVH